MKMNKVAMWAAVGAVLITCGCAAESTDEPVAAVCESSVAPDPELAPIIASVPLQSGKVLWAQQVGSSDDRALQSVMVNLCGVDISSPDDLRPIATEYAKAFKASPFADRIDKMYVANYELSNGKELTGETKLKVDRFQSFLWNGKPTPAAELQLWQVVGG